MLILWVALLVARWTANFLWELSSFVLGVLATIAVGTAAYIYVFWISEPLRTGHSHEYIEQSLLKRRFELDYESAEDVYRCGWVYWATEYEEHLPVDLLELQKMEESPSRTRPASVYFLVLKHNSLFLYHGEEQTDCAGMAVIEGCLIDIYPHSLLLDEVYSKDFPIRIFNPTGLVGSGERQVFMYAANGNEKEEWLFALRRASRRNKPFLERERSGLGYPGFMERLEGNLHSQEIDPASQWINALLGRIFFNIHRSGELERLVHKRFVRKMGRIKRPFFLGEIQLKHVTLGGSLPMFSDGKLHSTTPNGELIVSVDVAYGGGFRMEVETEARIAIHSKVKPLVVPLILAAAVERFSGRALIRIKAPPSDRLWYGFYQLPLLQLAIEPVRVSTKAISWPLIHQLVQKRIHDSLYEYVVLPNMDDFCIPPLVSGDRFVGEKPFELDRMPETLYATIHRSREAMEMAASPPRERSRSLGYPSSLELGCLKSLADSPVSTSCTALPNSSTEWESSTIQMDPLPSPETATSKVFSAMRRSVNSIFRPHSADGSPLKAHVD